MTLKPQIELRTNPGTQTVTFSLPSLQGVESLPEEVEDWVRNWRTALAKVCAAGSEEGAGSEAGTLASVSGAVNKAHLIELAKLKSTYPLAEDLANYTEQWQASVQLYQTRPFSLRPLIVQASRCDIVGNRCYKIKTNYMVEKVMTWETRTSIKGSKGLAGYHRHEWVTREEIGQIVVQVISNLSLSYVSRRPEARRGPRESPQGL